MPLTTDELERLNDMLQAIEPESKTLSQREKGFIDDQISRVAKYGVDTFMSSKQWSWIKSIYERVTGDRGDDEPPPADDPEDYGET